MERRNFLKSAGAGSLLGALSPLVTFAKGNTIPQPPPLGRGGGVRTLSTESADLSPYTGPWGDAQLRHLLRRAMFGVPESQFIAARSLGSMNAVVTKLLDTTLPLPPEPGNWVESFLVPVKNNQVADQNENRLDNMRTQELTNWWFDLMVQENLSIRERLTLMWTNHFVTGSTVVGHTGFMYTYLQTCRQNALGNFKSFATSISTDPAMLVYLNGNQNYVIGNKSFANENYARELMELFTLGINDPKTGLPNYTETDIQNSARALTGWTPTEAWPFVGYLQDGINLIPNTTTVTPVRHDTGTKTFLGQTGNFGLTDIINIIFEQGSPAGYTSAYWACQKLYQEFVYYIPNPSVVDAMANLMLANNFEIVPVLQALLTSAHFYDVKVIGAQLKSPAIYAGSLVREFGLTYPAFDPTDPPQKDQSQNPTLVNVTYVDTNPSLSIITNIFLNVQGQQLLNPPNVKGWPGGHNWVSTGTFQEREVDSLAALNNIYVNAKENWDLAFSANTYGLQIPNATSLTAKNLGQALEDLSLAFTLGPLESGDLYANLEIDYKDPNYQFDPNAIKVFAPALTQLPEFQLF